jgi:hypothetical protein
MKRPGAPADRFRWRSIRKYGPPRKPPREDTMNTAMPMMNAMGSMPMNNMMPMMNGMMGMPMMNGMMGMPMMNGMGMPNMGMAMMPMMMPGMMPMMCKMSCEMTKDGMVMKMMPTDASMMPRMKERCEAMQSMMAMGAPMMMMCGGMPMMVCMPTTK